MAKTKDRVTATNTSPKTSEPVRGSSRKKKLSPKKAAAIEEEIQRGPKMSPKKAAGTKTSPARRSTKLRSSPAKVEKQKNSPTKSTNVINKASEAIREGIGGEITKKLRPGDESDYSQWPGFSTEDILWHFDRRTLTKADRIYLEAIEELESDQVASVDLSHLEKDGILPNCHYYIWRRFHHLNKSGPTEQVDESSSSEDTSSSNETNRKAPAPTSGRSRSKSPVKEAATQGRPRGPNRLANPPVLSPSKVSQSAEAIERPFHSPVSLRSPNTPRRHISHDGRVQKNRPTPATIGYKNGHRSDAKQIELEKVAKRSKAAHLAGRREEPFLSSSAAKHGGIKPTDFKEARDKGIHDAQDETERRNMQNTLRGVDQAEQDFNGSDAEEVMSATNSGILQESSTAITPRRATARSPSKTTVSNAKAAEQIQHQIEIELEKRKGLVDGENSFGPDKENRGKIFSSTNPAIIKVEGKERVNPFFETMPAPEVWHRRMPPFFMFGETKYMEQKLSDQINADLNRTHEEPQGSQSPTRGLFDKVKDTMRAAFSSRGTSEAPDSLAKEVEKVQTPQRDDPWALPPVTPNAPRHGTSTTPISSSPKRKASQSVGSSSKRTRTADSTNPDDYAGY